MYKFFKPTIVLAFIACVSFNGCKTDEYPVSITFKNTTGENITLISFSKEVKNDLPVIIKPKTETEILANHDHCETIHYTFLYKEGKYYTNTGYSQDYNRFTIVFSENGQNNIECLFKGRFFGKDDTYLISFEENHE